MKTNSFHILAHKILIVLIVTVGLNFTGCAKEKAIITTENLRVILPPPVAKSTSIYGTIRNTGNTSDTLINISSNAGMLMLHKTEIKNGMAQMNHVDKFRIDAGKELILKPMSYHLMLMNINHDIIKESGKITLNLVFKNSGKLVIQVPVLTE